MRMIDWGFVFFVWKTLLAWVIAMVPIAGLVALLCWLLGCTTTTRWMPCPDGLTISGTAERGTVNGADLAKLVSGGESDGVDSNYEGWSAGAAMHFRLGDEPARCRTWGGEGGE